MNIVTVSSRNQIAIPVALLRELNFGSGSKLILDREDERIFIKPLKKSVTDSVAGSLQHLIPKSKLKTPWKKVFSTAMKAKAYAIAHN